MLEREVLERRKKKKRLFYIKLAVLAVVVLLGIAVVIGAGVLGEYNGVELSGDVHITIPEGTGTSKIAAILEENGVINHTKLFSVSAQMSGYDKKMRSGDFVVKNGMSYSEIMELLSSSSGEELVKVTIPEGFEVTQIAERLEQAGLVSVADFMAALSGEYEYRFLEGLPERSVKLEGYLFPDTYMFSKNMSAKDIVAAMLDNFDKHFKDEYYTRAQEMGYSVDDIVTLASIIERETNTQKERAKVAGVFYNRLNSNMRLQSCATVQYALGERKSVLSIADTKIDSPYNTYINDGLPIGPIASPGNDCIVAALYPEATGALFFVLDSDGNHVFSNTYEEHMAAKANAAIKVE